MLGEDGAPFLDPNKNKAYIVEGKCWVNNHAHVLKGKTNVCDDDYLCIALNYADYSNAVTGSTRLKLPQNMKGIDASDYIAGYGDPKYVLYYESFPLGEEEAWNINRESAGLYAIVATDIVFGLIPGGKIMNKVNEALTKLFDEGKLSQISNDIFKTDMTESVKDITKLNQ